MDTQLPVLVVDDSAAMSRVVCGLLESCGFRQIEQARSGQAAFDQLHMWKFCLVISDVVMRPMNGLELLRAVRADRQLSDLCFVLMSALNKSEIVVEASLLKADCFLLKPFSLDTLRGRLSRLRKLHTHFQTAAHT
jgi:two-component system chemotaxis response regulator CheY